jgi:hypothetical protein
VTGGEEWGVRTYDDDVQVRAGATGTAPGQFLWRGRLYVVRDVVSHWYERTSWWDGAAGRALRGETDGSSAQAAGEREVWRVEASAGRAAGTGVFDLSTAPAADSPASWRLLRVVD